MAYIVSYTQSDYNGNSTSGTLSDTESTTFNVTKFIVNSTRAPFYPDSDAYTLAYNKLTDVPLYESSFNESGGVFSNSHQGLTISIGLDTELEYSTIASSYTGSNSSSMYFSNVDAAMITYTSPVGSRYVLPTDDVEVVRATSSYRNLRLVAVSTNGAAIRCSLRVIDSTSSVTSALSSSSVINSATFSQSTIISKASMPSATALNLTSYSRLTSSYSLTFNLTSVDSQSSVHITQVATRTFNDSYVILSTVSSLTNTGTLTTIVVNPELSQVSVVGGVRQYNYMTSITSTLYTGPLENVLTDSSSASYTSSTFNTVNKTGGVTDFRGSVTYFVTTDLKINTDSFNLYSVDSTISTRTLWVEYNSTRYSLRCLSSYVNTSIYTQSAINSLSVTLSSLTSEAYQDYIANSYKKEVVSTSSTSLDYDTYYYLTTSSTLKIYISNNNYSETTTYSLSSLGAIKHIKETISTSSCNVTSYTDEYGYAYCTTFYGLLVTGTVSVSSWENSAIVFSSFSDYVDNLTKYTVGYTDKIFGNAFSSTTIHEESTLHSIVYTTISSHKSVSELYVDSSTLSSVVAPYEYFTTKYTSSSNVTEYNTYIGPNIGWNGPGLETYYDYNVTITSIGSNVWGWNFISSSRITSSVLNSSDYGTTYRLSELISSSSWVNIGNVNGTLNYRYSYDVDSMFSYNTLISTLSNYTTLLATTYSVSYNTVTEALSYSFTATQSNTVKTTGERFIDKIEIYRTSTVGVFGRNTVAVFSGSTLNTVSSKITTESAISTSQDVSTVDRTFITSSADFTTDTELITQDTLSSVSNRFISSSSFIISTTYEQQNETLMFKTSYNKYSYYYNTSYYSTVDTIKLTISASTYESLYVPASFTTTSGYTSRSSTTGSYSSSTLMTSLSSYTTTWMPVYTTVDGVYITE